MANSRTRAGSRAPISRPGTRHCRHPAPFQRVSSTAGSTGPTCRCGAGNETGSAVCLLVLAWRSHPRYRLVVAANRDEFHARPAAALAPWDDLTGVVAGRDLSAGGTWFAIDDQRR